MRYTLGNKGENPLLAKKQFRFAFIKNINKSVAVHLLAHFSPLKPQGGSERGTRPPGQFISRKNLTSCVEIIKSVKNHLEVPIKYDNTNKETIFGLLTFSDVFLVFEYLSIRVDYVL